MVNKMEKSINWYESKPFQKAIITIASIILVILFVITIIRGIIIYS